MTKNFTFYLLSVCCALLLAAASPDQGYKVGDTATDFKLKNIDGKFVSMKDGKSNKGYIVAFTCNECPYAKLYEDRLIALHNKYAPLGYPVIAINPNDPTVSPDDKFELMQTRAREKKYPFPYLVDETQKIARTYGATRTPHIYIVNKNGNNFKVAYIGTIDDNSRDEKNVSKRYVESAVDELLAGKPVTANNTKAIGCTIKWRDS